MTATFIFPGGQLITDDLQVKAFLASHNQMQNLIPEHPWDHVCILFQTETHWCGAAYDDGHADPTDNGYSLMMLDKSQMTLETATAYLDLFRQAGRLEPDGPCSERIAVNEPAYH